jgi:hypothetical protein
VPDVGELSPRPSVVQYLGVRSLLSFASTSKFLRAVVSRETERRKTCIVEIEAEVKRLLVPHQKQSTDLSGYIEKEARYEMTFSEFQEEAQERIWGDDFVESVRRSRFIENSSAGGDEEEVIVKNPPRENVIAANRTAYRGMRLIDDEIYSLHAEGANAWPATESTEDLWESETSMGTLFNRIAQQVPTSVLQRPEFFFLCYLSAENRRDSIGANTDLHRCNIFRKECDALLSLDIILPDCFYFPPKKLEYNGMEYVSISREFSALSRGAIRKASRHSALVRAALLRSGLQVAEALMGDGQWSVGSADLHACFESTSYSLARDGIIDAFRIAARETVFKFPEDKLMDCLWYTIEMADRIYGRMANL